MALAVLPSLVWETLKKQCAMYWTYGVGGVTAIVVLSGLRSYTVYLKISRKIRSKQKQCKESFRKIENRLQLVGLDQDECTRLLNLSSLELQQGLQDGSIKAVDVLHAYQTHALEVNQRLNCITEPLVDAEMLAVEMDGLDGEKGMLHGIPVSLKESYNLTGAESTAGLGQFIGDVASQDAVLVKVIKKQGAVPFVRTNIPQTMMTYECSNPIYGQTNNPYDMGRSPGGSTGGEAALIGSGASIIGFGSDIGGSIRAPAHFCGCYGLKTTLERLSRKGHLSLSKGQTQVSGTVGPMSRDLEGLVLAMRALLCDYHFQLDPQVPPIKFREEIYRGTKPLRIGYFVTNGYIDSVPACQRAVMMAKKALEAKGHTVVEFKPPRVKYAIPGLYMKTVLADKGKTYTSRLKHDILDPTLKMLMMPSKLPTWLLWCLSWVMQKAARDPVFGEVLRARVGIKSVYDWWQHCITLQNYKQEFLAAWQDLDLDIVISPVFACTAIPHGKVVDVLTGGSYCMLYNILNYPAGTMPVTKVTGTDLDNMTTYPKVTRMEKIIHKLTVGSEGLPVGVQVAGLPFQEELVLRAMRNIETGLTKQQ